MKTSHWMARWLQFDPAAKTDKTWRPFGGAGVFALQDIETSISNKARSKWMLGVQGGVEWVPDTTKRAKIGLGYYDYRNVSGVRNDFGTTTYNQTAPGYRQKGQHPV